MAQKERVLWIVMAVSAIISSVCFMAACSGGLGYWNSQRVLGGSFFIGFVSFAFFGMANEMRQKRTAPSRLAWVQAQHQAALLVREETRKVPDGVDPFLIPTACRLGWFKRNPRTVSFAPAKDPSVPAYLRRQKAAA